MTGPMITGDVTKLNNGKWKGEWWVGSRNGSAEFDTEQEAKNYVRRNIDREIGFNQGPG